ncbi:hypothetical protein [Pseudomonas syringae group sp. J309-1]|uniref:hypothetical protein n=1 Tax=Pseudomonas syringae group sp. J309-1 TaxID=3079588 RepID=UPI002906CE6C|nr:hypothetical protein [Pseudomonas syringae group sp. J309-1]MDU8357269.1 hypothetical protein [Pseudomonas syringae group sp. J309-1]
MDLDLISAALLGSAGGIAGMGIVLWLLRTWFAERIKQSIGHEYAVKLEEWKKSEQIRVKSEAIASLLAEWMSFPDDQRNLNKLTFEAYLWLPTDILRLLTKTLTHSATAPNARDILWHVRKHLLEDETLPASEIVIFKQESERRAFQAKMKEMSTFTPFTTPNSLGMKGHRGKNQPK